MHDRSLAILSNLDAFQSLKLVSSKLTPGSIQGYRDEHDLPAATAACLHHDFGFDSHGVKDPRMLDPCLPQRPGCEALISQPQLKTPHCRGIATSAFEFLGMPTPCRETDGSRPGLPHLLHLVARLP